MCGRCASDGQSACEYADRKISVARMIELQLEKEQSTQALTILLQENTALKGLIERLQEAPEPAAHGLYLQLRSEPHTDVQKLLQPLSLRLQDTPSEQSTDDSVPSPVTTIDTAPSVAAVETWTTVAEDELVSELIASWFMWDDAKVCSCIDKEALLASAGIGSTQFCSSFLINVMCAARCVSSVFRSWIQTLSNLTRSPVSIHWIKRGIGL